VLPKNTADVRNPAARKLIGLDARTLKDATGKMFGQELYDAAKEGQITEVNYMFPKPGVDTTLGARWVKFLPDVRSLRKATRPHGVPRRDSAVAVDSFSGLAAGVVAKRCQNEPTGFCYPARYPWLRQNILIDLHQRLKSPGA
jgi:hypothetical protein